ncbi:MAG: TIGR03619 family F420-dependent LLM class oxidoreductase [Myxococcota bacterium]
MRFSYAEAMCDPDHYSPLAVAVEQSGYSSFTIPDSIAYPEVSDSQYPYTPDGNREFLDGRPFIDPFVLAASLAAVTKTLRFTTFVVKLPIRQPVLLAKQAMSLAVMTKNRFGFGIGLSPWPEDFRICEQAWQGRGQRMEEMIEILRGLETGEFFGYTGEFFQLERIKMSPAPTARIPILLGGHADVALRRAARIGDGWMHAGGDAQQLDVLIERINQLRKEYGRDHLPFEFHVISLDGFSADGVKRLEDQGVTDVIVGFRDLYAPDTMKLDQKIAAAEKFANSVIQKL